MPDYSNSEVCIELKQYLPHNTGRTMLRTKTRGYESEKIIINISSYIHFAQKLNGCSIKIHIVCCKLPKLSPE